MRHMRFVVPAIVGVLTCIAAAHLSARSGEDARAASVLAEMRKALGGEGTPSRFKALSLRAEFTREMSAGGPGAVVMMHGGAATPAGSTTTIAGTIDIDVQLPDKFYREESASSGMRITRIDGFDGNRPFMDAFSDHPGTRVMVNRPPDDPDRAASVLRRTNADLARLLLGLVGTTHPLLPVTYSYVARAESPDGTADVLEVTGPENFKARLFVDTATHLPLMLTYFDVEQEVRMMTRRGEGPPRGDRASRELTAEERAAMDRRLTQHEPPKTREFRMFFSDYRETDGLVLPYRIARGTADKTTEEWLIKTYKVNPDISPTRFKVGTK